MASQSCPETNKAGGPCGGWVPDGATHCRVHDSEFLCGECGAAAPRGEDLCRRCADPNDMKLRTLQARVRKFEGMQRRKPKRRFYEEGWDDLTKDARQCAAHFGVDPTTATRWYKQVRFDRAKANLRVFKEENWPVEDQEIPASHFDWTEEHIPLLIDGFLAFRERFFKTPQRTPYETPGFQRKWARTLLSALIKGGREMILAPQRHGKTMELRHLCMYLIGLDPNIRILWVSAAQKTAEKTTSLMRGIFASNEELIEEYAGVGGTFVPDRKSPHRWTNQEFTVATRTDFDINGPNMQALGREGTILSLDADIIIVDDIEDKNSVNQLGTRENTKEWWDTQLSSRKEEHTGVFIIGSRQHADDLYSYLLANDQYNVTVEQAHDPTCDVEGFDGHWDCLLFPEVRSYRWLIGQKLAMRDQARWEMIYQNVARTAGLVVFPEDELKACRSGQYAAREIPRKEHGVEGGVRLVGGLDPAISGFQAGVLFAYQTYPELKIWLVDLDNKSGGGASAFESLIRRWYEKYGLAYWVAESNLLGRLSEYKEIRDLTSRHGIHVQDWHTGHNKNQEFFGVTSLARLFEHRNIVLPYADSYSEGITDELIGQFAIWDEANSRNKNRTGYKDDLVMACWQAWDPIRRARQDFNAEMGVELGSYVGFEFSDVPWDTMLEAV